MNCLITVTAVTELLACSFSQTHCRDASTADTGTMYGMWTVSGSTPRRSSTPLLTVDCDAWADEAARRIQQRPSPQQPPLPPLLLLLGWVCFANDVVTATRAIADLRTQSNRFLPERRLLYHIVGALRRYLGEWHRFAPVFRLM